MNLSHLLDSPTVHDKLIGLSWSLAAFHVEAGDAAYLLHVQARVLEELERTLGGLDVLSAAEFRALQEAAA